MAEIIKMPKLSDTMEEGVVAKWHKQVGDQVEEGELLADIETDKATMEFESFQTGVLLHQGVSEGEASEVDSILAIVGEKGENIDDLIKGGSTSSSSSSEEKNEETTSSSSSSSEASAKEESSSSSIDTSDVNAKIIKMPKLSDTMEEGTVAAWVKHKGDKVESGEILAEIETDKATMEFESFEDGVLLYQGVSEGDSAPVDAILAIIGEEGADYQKLIDSYSSNGSKDSEPKDEPKEESAPKPAASSSPAPAPAASSSSSSSTTPSGRIKVSPLAKKLAEDKGIDLNTVKGSGDGGRIVKRDIENYQPSAAATSVPAASTAAVGQESYEDRAVSQMRKTIAKRLSESKFTAPHFYLTMDIDMDEAINARKSINAMPDTKVSFNDLVIRASAAALKKHPMVNAAWMGDKIRMNQHVHIGVAVAVDEGLLVPVIRFADQKGLSAISAEVKELAGKARDKKLQPEEWEGSTFSISNLGMFGIEEFTAIINPPNSCIMAVGAIREEVVVKDGEMKVGNRMKVTLSCDHRVVDGATGAEFLNSFKTYLENPVTILA
ncbi:MAG: pyruvate dehydrogenase complex dihydrolipoamide acetyltransferase [Flavobacteriales bacterium]|nr:pyruvate dehydrogenase complex dihydrolipoamide acetyltransferase [Flavobacteriales bacterium]